MDITNRNGLFPVQTTWSNLEISSSPIACHSIIWIWACRRDVFSQVSQSQHPSRCWSLNAKWTEGNRFSSSSVVVEAGGSYLTFNSVSVCSRFGWDAVIAANMVLCFKFDQNNSESVFQLWLNSVCRASKPVSLYPLQWIDWGMCRRLGGDTTRQMTQKNLRDIPHHIAPCSAIKLEKAGGV